MGGLNPRALATLGIGFGASLVARLGIWPAAVFTEDMGGSVTPPRSDDPQRRRRRDDETLLVIGAL